MSSLPTYMSQQFASRLVSNKTLPVLSGSNRSTSCWAYGWDLTAFPVDQRGGCLVSRSVFMTTNHDPARGVGDTITLYNNNSVAVSRKITAQTTLATYLPNPTYGSALPDIRLFLLESPVPDSITPVRFLPSSYSSILPNNGAGVGVVCINSNNQAVAFNTLKVEGTYGGVTRAAWTRITSGTYVAFSLGLSPYESSSPVFYPTPSGPILLALAHVQFNGGVSRAGTPYTQSNPWDSLLAGFLALGTDELPLRLTSITTMLNGTETYPSAEEPDPPVVDEDTVTTCSIITVVFSQTYRYQVTVTAPNTNPVGVVTLRDYGAGTPGIDPYTVIGTQMVTPVVGSFVSSSADFIIDYTVYGSHNVRAVFTAGTGFNDSFVNTSLIVVNPATPTLTSITITPTGATLNADATQQFTAVGYDQDGTPMSPQPTFTWSVSGSGSINSSTGLYTAPSTASSDIVTCTSGTVSANAAVTVSVETTPPSVISMIINEQETI